MSDDPVRIQINFVSRVPKGKKITKKILQAAVERWAYAGVDSKWIDIRAVHWLNPERKDAGLARWKVATAADVGAAEYARLSIPGELMTGDTLEQARRSLRLAEMPPEAFAAMLYVKEMRQPAKRKGGNAPNAKKRKGSISSVRNPKRKNKKK